MARPCPAAPASATTGPASCSAQYDSASIGDTVNPQYRRAAWGFFVQDTWKISRKLTLDYGLRYDLQQPMRELWHRTSGFNRRRRQPQRQRPAGRRAL